MPIRNGPDQQTRFFLRLLPLLVVLFDAPLIVWILIGHAEVPVLVALGLIALIPAVLVVLVVKGKIRIGAAGGNSEK
jgi:hypothetical protein